MKESNLRRLIREVLEPKQLYSKNAEELLVLTAAAESLGGEYLYQTNGPARGFFQMEPNTEKDILENYVRYKSSLRDALKKFICFNTDGTYSYRINDPLTYSLEYQVLISRIHYLRKPEAIPHVDDSVGLSEYWKKHYNTTLGKGRPIEARVKYYEYVGVYTSGRS